MLNGLGNAVEMTILVKSTGKKFKRHLERVELKRGDGGIWCLLEIADELKRHKSRERWFSSINTHRTRHERHFIIIVGNVLPLVPTSSWHFIPNMEKMCKRVWVCVCVRALLIITIKASRQNNQKEVKRVRCDNIRSFGMRKNDESCR